MYTTVLHQILPEIYTILEISSRSTGVYATKTKSTH
ncbi:MAG: hypothetical protein KME54_28295 [Tolypothrix brevis GSE-NOS-MK-07-07A]|nr:hypothetical protein [Tolypothrix brevis GSE-NOS-MK-07-07A]